MEEIGKQYINAKTRAGFQTALDSGKVSDSQVAFIEDEDLIWARGKYYGTIPNEEDLIKDTEGKLQLSDRSYNPENFSGLGRIILRKNMSAGKNILTQEMISQANTVYEIRYDFDLSGATINIPENCTLDFQGGSLSNGTLNGNKTYIKYSYSVLYNIILKGIYSNDEIKISLFNSNRDITDSIQSILDINVKNIFFDLKDIEISKPLYIQNRKNIYGYNYGDGNVSKIFPANNFTSIHYNKNGYEETIKSIFYMDKCYGTVIHNLYMDGKYKVNCGIQQVWKGSTSISIYNNYFAQFILSAILLTGTENCNIKRNYIYFSGCGILASISKVNKNNLLDFTLGVGSMINLLKVDNNYIIYCNYGIIFNFGTDVILNNNIIGHSSTWALYAKGETLSLGNLYLEGNGHSLTWVDDNGFTDNRSKNIIVPQLINGWGVESIETPLVSTKYKIRGYCYFRCNITSNSIYTSYKYIRTNTNDNWKITTSNNTNIGVDTLFVFNDGSVASLNKVNLFNNTGESDKQSKFIIICIGGYSNIIIDSLPFNYKDKDCLLQIGSNISAIPNYKDFGIKILSFSDTFNQYKYIYSSCLRKNAYINTDNIHLFIDDYIIKNNKKYFKLKNNIKNIVFRYPLDIFIDGLKYIKVYTYNSKTSDYNIAISAHQLNGISNYNRDELISNNRVVNYKNNIIGLYIPYYNLNPNNKYIDIIIENGKGTVDYNEDIYISVPYIIDPYKNTNFSINEDEFNLKKGTTSQRPTGVQIGYTYKDTDLGKWIIWGGDAWENIDGSPLE